jgi:uncharacterized SAM-binding protein YcdF (DUF218 family)
MSFLKLLATALTTPLLIALLVSLLAGGIRLLGRRRISSWLLVLSGMLVYLATIPLVGESLLGPLERRFTSAVSPSALRDVRWVVVLGSGYAPRDNIPVTGALSGDALPRIVEGIRLVREIPGTQLIASGGAPGGGAPAAEGYALLARELGIADTSVVTLSDPLDTADEARALAGRLRGTPFILVTSAYHMPRAMRLMERQGLQPIPAPTGQLAGDICCSLKTFIPSGNALRKTERALHEYLGLLAIAAGLE